MVNQKDIYIKKDTGDVFIKGVDHGGIVYMDCNIDLYNLDNSYLDNGRVTLVSTDYSIQTEITRAKLKAEYISFEDYKNLKPLKTYPSALFERTIDKVYDGEFITLTSDSIVYKILITNICEQILFKGIAEIPLSDSDLFIRNFAAYCNTHIEHSFPTVEDVMNKVNYFNQINKY